VLKHGAITAYGGLSGERGLRNDIVYQRSMFSGPLMAHSRVAVLAPAFMPGWMGYHTNHQARLRVFSLRRLQPL